MARTAAILCPMSRLRRQESVRNGEANYVAIVAMTRQSRSIGILRLQMQPEVKPE